MMKIHCRFIAVLATVIGILASHNTFANDDKVYIIGVVPQFEARKLQKIWKPVLAQLEKNTGLQFELKGAPSIPAFEKALSEGAYDFAYMNPYHLLVANQQQGYSPLVRDNGRKLSGILTVRKDSNINSVKDLNGKIIAFPSPNAFGASLQMRAELTDIYKINFKTVYVKTHDSVYLNVLLKQATAGGGVKKTFNKQKDTIKSNLKIIHSTEPVVPHPFAVHPRINNATAKKVTQALLNMGKDEQTNMLLQKIPMKKIGPASLAEYKVLDKLNLKRFYVKSY